MSCLTHQQLFKKENQKWLAVPFGKWAILAFLHEHRGIAVRLLAVLCPPSLVCNGRGPSETRGLGIAMLTTFQWTMQRNRRKAGKCDFLKKNQTQASKVLRLKTIIVALSIFLSSILCRKLPAFPELPLKWARPNDTPFCALSHCWQVLSPLAWLWTQNLPVGCHGAVKVAQTCWWARSVAPAVRLFFAGAIFIPSGEVDAILVHVTASEGRATLVVSSK